MLFHAHLSTGNSILLLPERWSFPGVFIAAPSGVAPDAVVAVRRTPVDAVAWTVVSDVAGDGGRNHLFFFDNHIAVVKLWKRRAGGEFTRLAGGEPLQGLAIGGQLGVQGQGLRSAVRCEQLISNITDRQPVLIDLAQNSTLLPVYST